MDKVGQIFPVSARTQVLLAWYAAALGVVALGLVAAVLGAGLTLEGPLWGLAVLAAVAMLAERQPVRITANQEMTVAVLPMLFAAVVFGPVDAMVVGALGLVPDFRRPFARWLIWSALRCVAGGCAGLVALVVLSATDTFGGLVLAVALAALTDALLDFALSCPVIALRTKAGARDFTRTMWPLLLTSVPFYTPVIVLLAYAYEEVSSLSLLFFFAPTFAAQTLYRLYREERQATERLQEANERLRRANLSFATALVATLDARDRYTAGHSAAVAVYARDIASRMGLSAEQQQLAHQCGLVHDIGKIGLPVGLLDKPGALTLDERRQMEEHSQIGERILSKVEDYSEIATIVRHHHERLDGQGYPDGLKEDEIPLLSRIIGVADAYNAMTSDRPYRDAMPSRVARMRIAQAVESQFDTTVAAAFEAILAGSSEEYRSGRRFDFSLEAQDQNSEIGNISRVA